MLRRAACSLLRPQVQALGASTSAATSAWAQSPTASYSNLVPEDYSLVMRKAHELSDTFKKVPDTEVGICAGVPMETYKRPARIFVSARSPSQQGMGKTKALSTFSPQWRIAFDTTMKWENQLMGWTSTADPLENVARASLFFDTKEAAMAFCDKHGWEYTVDMPNERRTTRQKRFNSYGDNFSTRRKGIPDLSHTEKHATYT
mmetsp:Transcript_81749/g.166561  ORF Transcript_81749/g.166561 Transcript_81749/m.166561 type:complete len:203 (+) Transcript_81749:2-610(+)